MIQNDLGTVAPRMAASYVWAQRGGLESKRRTVKVLGFTIQNN